MERRALPASPGCSNQKITPSVVSVRTAVTTNSTASEAMTISARLDCSAPCVRFSSASKRGRSADVSNSALDELRRDEPRPAPDGRLGDDEQRHDHEKTHAGRQVVEEGDARSRLAPRTQEGKDQQRNPDHQRGQERAHEELRRIGALEPDARQRAVHRPAIRQRKIPGCSITAHGRRLPNACTTPS